MIELRILSGARAGHVERFTKSVVSIGRHALNDLRLDQERDIEASRRHAEIRVLDEKITVHDLSSTNGTWINGERVRDEYQIRSGDVISFGREGPRVEVVVVDSSQPPLVVSTDAELAPVAPSKPTPVTPSGRARSASSNAPKLIVAAAALVVVVAAGAFWAGRSGSTGDTAAVERYGSPSGLDVVDINARNANAVAFLAYEIAGKAYAGTAFCISEGGLMVTNRHNVQSANGLLASRLAVKFRDTREWIPLRVVSVAKGEDDDLALVQIDQPGFSCPAVAALAPDGATLPEGTTVVTIGYPLALDARMEGAGDDFVAKTSLVQGTISKQVTGVMQVASYAGHGSSGSPVFDARGLVVGVVWGGPQQSGGQLIYAVPAERVLPLIPAQ